VALNPNQLREGAKSTAWSTWSEVGFGILTPAAFASFASQNSSPRSASSGAQGKARRDSESITSVGRRQFQQQLVPGNHVQLTEHRVEVHISATVRHLPQLHRPSRSLIPWCTGSHSIHSNERSRFFSAASFGVLAPPFSHEWIFLGVTSCFIEVCISTSSMLRTPGSQLCCLKAFSANTPASYRLSASTSTVCRRPSVSR